MRIGVLTISDRVSKGEMEDRGGGAVVRTLQHAFPEAELIQAVVPDERDQVSGQLRTWVDEDRLDTVITTGGTGLGPRDVTPEATLDVIRYRVPGIEESLRAKGISVLPAAMLSRGVAGVRERTLIVNLPGSPSGAREGTEVLTSVLAHAVDLLHGWTRHHHGAAGA
jgi:molybdenum cofactor synthesis domain-containing protein